MNTRRVITTLLIVLTLGLQVALIWYLVRTYLTVPVLAIAWVLDVIYQIVPQVILWFILLGLAFLAGIYSIGRRPRPKPEALQHVFPDREKRVSILAEWIEKRSRRYYRSRLNSALTRLAVDMVAQKRNLGTDDIREEMRQGRIELPGPVVDYLHAHSSHGGDELDFETDSLVANFLRRNRPKIDRGIMLDQLVDYLEEEIGDIQ